MLPLGVLNKLWSWEYMEKNALLEHGVDHMVQVIERLVLIPLFYISLVTHVVT